MKELYDLEAVYDEQISPLMQKIIEICNQHQMPMLCSFAFHNDADLGVGDCTTLLNSFDGRFHAPFVMALRAIRIGPSCTAFAITRTGTVSKEVSNG
ncbi:hypothetical protein FVB43_18820 [Erwinia rhapontici]|uniref:hypothetical protein n=1 Tax=Erwinia rhapontici TaxID=55212 RepID=UPI0014384C1C|nr:hypothetical protein [Erwinia rhapontici]NKG32084.1 hypothetical protein [Erwinia rhapontici]